MWELVLMTLSEFLLFNFFIPSGLGALSFLKCLMTLSTSVSSIRGLVPDYYSQTFQLNYFLVCSYIIFHKNFVFKLIIPSLDFSLSIIVIRFLTLLRLFPHFLSWSVFFYIFYYFYNISSVINVFVLILKIYIKIKIK